MNQMKQTIKQFLSRTKNSERLLKAIDKTESIACDFHNNNGNGCDDCPGQKLCDESIDNPITQTFFNKTRVKKKKD